MKPALLFLILLTLDASLDASLALAGDNACSCRCVTKDSDGNYTVASGQGKDREAAGDDLKKNLGSKKCEISPDCTGHCHDQ